MFGHTSSPPSTSVASMASPRSSISSSHRSGVPLTPVYELDKMASEMVITSDTDDVQGGDGDEVDGRSSPRHQSSSSDGLNGLTSSTKGRPNLPTLNVPSPPFGNYTFGLSTSPSSSASSMDRRASPSPGSTNSDSVSLSEDESLFPKQGFSFGTCPSAPFLGTPTAEQGPFQYPDSLSRSISPPTMPGSPPLGAMGVRRESLALGMTHRRGSIVAHPHSDSMSMPSPPSTRRSSTCSTIVTLPAGGRRPSIVHSATIETSIPQAEPFPSPYHPETGSSSSSFSGPSMSRRGSALMFPQRQMSGPIPPSLLARRGSLPAAQLFGLPHSDQHTAIGSRMRSSYSVGTSNHVTTAASLYNRRQSIASSEGGHSSGSGATVMEGDLVRRHSMKRSGLISPASESGYGLGNTTRRGSVSFFPPVPPSPKLPQRSSSISSNSGGSISSTSSRGSFSSSRVPINFSPRHPSYASNSKPNTHAHPHGDSHSHSRHSTSTTNASSPSSPRLGFAHNYSMGSGRTRHASTGGTSSKSRSSSGLSSSSESNEEENEEEELLPTPSQSSSSVRGGVNVPTFVDPWSSATGGAASGLGYELEDGISSQNQSQARKSLIPLETPPLETVMERPPLESVDSGKTERA